MATPTAPSEEKNLLHYASILWRRKWTIALCLVVAVVVTVLFDSHRTKKYSATATMQLLSQNISLSTGLTTPLTPTDIATAIQLVQSTEVRARVSISLGTIAPVPAVSQVGVTEVLSVSVTDASPALAAQTANLYVNSYIHYTTERFNSQIAQQEAILRAQIQSYEAQVKTLEQEIASTPANSSALTGLNSQLQQLSGTLQSANLQLNQLAVAQTQASNGAVLVSPAITPKSPSSPQPLTDALIALVFGAILGCALALLFDFLDDRIRTKEQLLSSAGGLPLLGEIPQFDDWKDVPENTLISVLRPNSQASEAYRSLRTSIQFIGFDTDRTKVIQITSPTEGDGKTTTAANLAVTMAMSGARVALVSCDLRRPSLHNYFGVDNLHGLSTVLSSTDAIDDVVVTPTEFPTLKLIPSGPIPPNPSELLGSRNASQLFELLRGQVDIILIDSPPVLPVTDAVVLAQVADAVVLIAHAGETHGRDVAHALQLLSGVDASLEGTVLNGIELQGGRYRYRYSRYRYSYRASPYSANTVLRK